MKPKKLLSFILAVVMIISLLPTFALTASATTSAAASKKSARLTRSLRGAQQAYIYFGTYGQSSDGNGGYSTDPIKWRVLSNSGGKLFLLSEKNLDIAKFHTQEANVAWATSTIRSWLNGYGGTTNAANVNYSTNNFILSAFSATERGVIADTTVETDVSDKIFLLSYAEVHKADYGFVDTYLTSEEKISTNTDYAASKDSTSSTTAGRNWWLRSSNGDGKAKYVAYNGCADTVDKDVTSMIGVRPAFNIDSSAVLLISPVAGGSSISNEFKLTLKDSAHNSFALTDTSAKTVKTGDTVSLSYTGAKTDANEYISAVLVKNSVVDHYAQLAEVTTASGTVNYTVPSHISSGEYELRLFNEQINGDYGTDFASDFQTVNLTVKSEAKIKTEPREITTLTYNGNDQALVSKGTSDDGTVLYSSSEDGTYSEAVPTGKNAGSYTVWYYIKGNSTHYDSGKTRLNDVKIRQASPSYTPPTARNAVFGDTLADVALPDVDNGTWSWQDGGSTPVGDVGTHTYRAVFTPSDTVNYKKAGADVSVEVAKATINSVTLNVTAPVAGGTPQDTVEGGTGYTAEDVVWTPTPTQTRTGVKFGYDTGYTATVTLTADGNHKFADGLSVAGWSKSAEGNTLTLEKTFDKTEIAKLTSLLRYPASTVLRYYHETAESAATELLQAVEYQKGAPGIPGAGLVSDVAIDWSCDSYNSALGATNTFTWSVRDGELADYQIASTAQTGGSIAVTNASVISVTHNKEDKPFTYDGTTYNVSQMFTKGITTAAPSYEVVLGGTGAGTLSGTSLTITKAGTINIKMSTAADGLYAAGDITATLTVAKGTGEASVTMAGWTYGGAESAPVANSATNGTDNVSYLYKVKGEGDDTYSAQKPQDIGEYTVKATFAATDLYEEVVKTADFSITNLPSGGGGGGTSRYTVKFDTNGGNKIASQSVKKNTTASEPKKPTRDGYTFDGWYTNSKLTAEYDFDTKVTKNITLYAKWTEDEIQNPSDDKKNDEPQNGKWKNPFADINENDWYFDSVKYANENGLMSGITDNEFAPKDNITRGMLVAILYRAEGEPAVNKSISFTDVNAVMYYLRAVIWAQQSSIVNGVNDTEFAPDESITREQLAAILYRYAQYKGYDVSVGEDTNILSYEDANEISEYAVKAMQYAVGSGLMKGKTESTLNPKDNATRAEIAAILQRFIEGNK